MLGYVVVTNSSKMSVQKTQNIMSHSPYLSLAGRLGICPISSPSSHRDPDGGGRTREPGHAHSLCLKASTQIGHASLLSHFLGKVSPTDASHCRWEGECSLARHLERAELFVGGLGDLQRWHLTSQGGCEDSVKGCWGNIPRWEM